MKKKPVEIIVSAMEDTFQSVTGFRVRFNEFVPAYEAAIHAGLTRFEYGGSYRSLDFWTGANPFDSMREMRSLLGREVTLIATGRSSDVLGTTSQPTDIITLYAELMHKYGMDVVRNLDPLNDAENFIRPGQCLQEKGIKHEVAILLSSLPRARSDYSELSIHRPEHYTELLRRFLNCGITLFSVAYLDPFGMSQPGTIHQIIRAARRLLPPDVEISFQSNNRTGASTMCYLAAIEGGADAVGLSLGTAPGGTDRPEISLMIGALRATETRLKVDVERLVEVEKVFTECTKKQADRIKEEDDCGLEKEFPRTSAGAMPRREINEETMSRYSNVLREMNDVIEWGGFATPVLPVSKYYFDQALLNVQLRPWERIDPNYAKLILGYFGRTPVKPDPSILSIAMGEHNIKTSSFSPVARADLDPSKGIQAALNFLKEKNLPAEEENLLRAATASESFQGCQP